jgi:hypothetical protein
MKKSAFPSGLFTLPTLGTLLTLATSCVQTPTIDREDLVSRHNVVLTEMDTLGSLTVGNGGFAFTVDVTGLQTFPETYSLGIPLGTQSDWGWHSFPDTSGYDVRETMALYRVDGRDIPYSVQMKEPPRSRQAAEYFRVNPHRLHLGTVGFLILNEAGEAAGPKDIEQVSQELDLWKGEIRSSFKVSGNRVDVITVCHPEKDMIAFRVQSDLLSTGKIRVLLRYPYPSGRHSDMACRWDLPDRHSSNLIGEIGQGATIERILDTTKYYTRLAWSPGTVFSRQGEHSFELSSGSPSMEVSVLFTPGDDPGVAGDFTRTRSLSQRAWKDFWMSGGAVDFAGSTDPRAGELERRIILSQYLTRVQCAGDQPPQETGLTYNSWYGKFHLEMAWWHMVHFPLWGRTELMEKSFAWYPKAAANARKTAERQGYEGIRWQKMTDPSGADSPSSVGSFLIWQQPHYIYLAELCYRDSPTPKVLEKYGDLVFATADFMASYALFNREKDRYELGPVLIPAQECFNARTTFNPPFELSYWYWGLSTAIRWAERMQVSPHPQWVKVLEKLSPLYARNGLYVPAESVPMAYEEGTHMHDHPAVLGAFGALPGNPLIDTAVMRKTFDFVWENWQWEETWGWDFPLTAMAAVRLGQPEKAMEALFMQPRTNTYLANGHNYQDGRLRLYLPGNGGLLTAVAMMCAGYDGCTTPEPGIPRDGTWRVRWEGLLPLP